MLQKPLKIEQFGERFHGRPLRRSRPDKPDTEERDPCFGSVSPPKRSVKHDKNHKSSPRTSNTKPSDTTIKTFRKKSSAKTALNKTPARQARKLNNYAYSAYSPTKQRGSDKSSANTTHGDLYGNNFVYYNTS